MGEPPLGKFEENPEYNFLCRLLNGETRWVLSASGVFEAVYLPTGLLDWRPLDAPPAAPPPGRVRLWFQNGTLFFNSGSGPTPVAGAADFLALSDTPGTYTGQAGLAAVVNPGETGLTFSALVTNLLALTDTPSSYAGQAGLHLAVNAGETGIEFVPGGSGGGGAAHHHSYPAVYYPTRISFTAATYTGLVHWPGWSAVDEAHWGNGLNAFLSTAPASFQVETDATTGRRVTSARAVANHEEASGWGIYLHRGVPGGFSDWDPEGIKVATRVEWTGVITTESLTITVEVYAPTNPADVVVATASRVVTANDAGFVEITVPQGPLQAAGFVGGDLLRMRIYASSVVVGANAIDSRTWLSRIQAGWSLSTGGGGGTPVTNAARRLPVYGGYA